MDSQLCPSAFHNTILLQTIKRSLETAELWQQLGLIATPREDSLVDCATPSSVSHFHIELTPRLHSKTVDAVSLAQEVGAGEAGSRIRPPTIVPHLRLCHVQFRLQIAFVDTAPEASPERESETEVGKNRTYLRSFPYLAEGRTERPRTKSVIHRKDTHKGMTKQYARSKQAQYQAVSLAEETVVSLIDIVFRSQIAAKPVRPSSGIRSFWPTPVLHLNDVAPSVFNPKYSHTVAERAVYIPAISSFLKMFLCRDNSAAFREQRRRLQYDFHDEDWQMYSQPSEDASTLKRKLEGHLWLTMTNALREVESARRLKPLHNHESLIGGTVPGKGSHVQQTQFLLSAQADQTDAVSLELSRGSSDEFEELLHDASSYWGKGESEYIIESFGCSSMMGQHGLQSRDPDLFRSRRSTALEHPELLSIPETNSAARPLYQDGLCYLLDAQSVDAPDTFEATSHYCYQATSINSERPSGDINWSAFDASSDGQREIIEKQSTIPAMLSMIGDRAQLTEPCFRTHPDHTLKDTDIVLFSSSPQLLSERADVHDWISLDGLSIVSQEDISSLEGHEIIQNSLLGWCPTEDSDMISSRSSICTPLLEMFGGDHFLWQARKRSASVIAHEDDSVELHNMDSPNTDIKLRCSTNTHEGKPGEDEDMLNEATSTGASTSHSSTRCLEQEMFFETSAQRPEQFIVRPESSSSSMAFSKRTLSRGASYVKKRLSMSRQLSTSEDQPMGQDMNIQEHDPTSLLRRDVEIKRRKTLRDYDTEEDVGLEGMLLR